MKHYEIRAQETGTELLIYGEIGSNWWADKTTEAADVIDALADIPGGEINVRINSVGGIVADALAIFNALQRHPARVVVDVDGVAFSAASLIAMAGDSIRMASNALMMIHAPLTIAEGNAADMDRAKRTLERFAAAMGASYTRGGRIDKTTVAGWLADGEDHYFTADEALEAGLVDEITGALAVAASAHNRAPMPSTARGNDMPEDTAQIEAQARQAERARVVAIQGILSMPAVQRIDAEARKALETEAIKDNWTEAKLQETVLARLGDAEPVAEPSGDVGAASGGTHIQAGADAHDKAGEGMTDYLLYRMGLDRDGSLYAKVKTGEFMGMSAVELARHSLGMAGVRIKGLNRDAIIGKAFTIRASQGISHTSSDFPAILENALGKAVLQGWTETEETWRMIAKVGNIPDFRPAPRSGLSEYPTLPEVPEGGEYRYVTISDRKETIVLLTYGSILGITRQVLVNDDLSQLASMGTKQGRAAARRVGDLVYLVLTGNPVMGQDGVPLFDAQHNNLATVVGPPTVQTLDNMKVLMALQTDPDDNAHGLNIPVQRVIVPKALETQSQVLRASQYDPADTNNSRAPNPFQNTFEVVADPRLDADSAVQWYTSANPNQYDIIEAGFLEGATEPYLETKEGWSIDGVEFKARIDCAAIPLDFRGLARNAGA